MTKVQIYNDRNESTNTFVEKKEAHSKGLWHRVFICILINKKTRSIILQKKIQNKYNFERPDYLDLSVGGHYDEDEKIEDGIRELKEEVGLDVKFDELISLGVRQNSVILGENYNNREFQHIFAYVLDNDLEKIILNLPHMIQRETPYKKLLIKFYDEFQEDYLQLEVSIITSIDIAHSLKIEALYLVALSSF